MKQTVDFDQRLTQNIRTLIASSLVMILFLVFFDAVSILVAKHQLMFILGLPLFIIWIVYVLRPYIAAIRSNFYLERDFISSITLGVLGTLVQFLLIRQCYESVSLLYWIAFSVMLVCIEFYLVRCITKWRTKLANQKILKRNTKIPLFLNDEPIDSDLDELGFADDAINFAKCVENNNASRSLVFGIDAPWGTGKTSYLELCKKQWKKDGCLVFEFSPLRYDRNDLIPLFLDSFGDFLLQNKYPRGVRILFRKYSRKIAEFPKMLNLDLTGFFSDGPSDEELLEALTEQLKTVERKTIVVIDDLDRLSIPNIKSFVDTVRVGLKLPNISFVLCFDTKNIFSFEQPLIRSESVEMTDTHTTENKQKMIKDDELVKTITRQNLDNTRLAEYLEKVVMIKQTLIINPKRIKEFLILHLFESNNEEGAMFSGKSKTEMLAAIDKFFDPIQFHQYADQLGDIRKIKRLINVMRLRFGGLNIDISQIDFNGYDLFILMMVYLNYPDVFRKIYLTEREGKEFFSLSYYYEERNSVYKNSDFYKTYIKSLSTIEQLLLNTIFNEKRFAGDRDPTLMSGADSAAFNGTLGSGRNLENYLKLIVETKLPEPTEEKKFYVELVRGLAGTNTLDAISQRQEFIFSDSNNAEQNFGMLLQAIIRNIDTPNLLSKDNVLGILNWFIANIAKFSIQNFEKFGIGLRDDLTLDVIYFLDKRGWVDQDGDYYHHSEEIVVQAADELLGTTSKVGLLFRLMSQDRGVLGIMDGVTLRLHCSPFRGGGLFNLQRGLVRRAQNLANTSGNTNDDTMREISQIVFAEFKQRYIAKHKNFITDVDLLNDKEIYGSSYGFVMQNNLHVDERIQIRKTGIKNFLIYQLTNTFKNQSDFGFGLFDESGVLDQKGIQKLMRDYLFGCCFGISDTNPDGAKFFVDYMVTNYEDTMGSRDSKYKIDIDRITLVVGKDELNKYWLTNRDAIQKNTKDLTGKISTGNYVIDYQVELPILFNALNQYTISSSLVLNKADV